MASTIRDIGETISNFSREFEALEQMAKLARESGKVIDAAEQAAKVATTAARGLDTFAEMFRASDDLLEQFKVLVRNDGEMAKQVANMVVNGGSDGASDVRNILREVNPGALTEAERTAAEISRDVPRPGEGGRPRPEGEGGKPKPEGEGVKPSGEGEGGKPNPEGEGGKAESEKQNVKEKEQVKEDSKAADKNKSSTRAYCLRKPKSCLAAVAAIGAGVYGAYMWKKLPEEERKCVAICLPENYPDNPPVYRKVTDVEGEDAPYLCAEGTAEECYDKCQKKCTSLESKCNILGFGAACEAINDGINAAGDLTKGVFEKLFDAIKGPLEWLLIGLAVVVVIYVAFTLFQWTRSSSSNQPQQTLLQQPLAPPPSLQQPQVIQMVPMTPTYPSPWH